MSPLASRQGLQSALDPEYCSLQGLLSGLGPPGHICPLLQPGPDIYPRVPSSLILMCSPDTHRTGNCSYGTVGILAPKAFWRSSSPWRGTRRCVSLSYSLHPCRHSLNQKLTCAFAGCTFMLPGCSRHPTRDISLLYWTDSTHASECGLAGAFPKLFDAASRSPLWTMVTCVTSRHFLAHLSLLVL